MTPFTSETQPTTESLTHDTPERSHPDLRPWVYSWTGHDRDWTGTYPTAQAAAADALTDTAHAEHQQLHLGRADHPLPSSFLDTETLLNELGDQADSEFGIDARDWLEDVSTEHRGDLERQLAQVLDDWAALHGHLPTFYEVSDVQELPLTAVQAFADAPLDDSNLS